jgi:hypothetical protein
MKLATAYIEIAVRSEEFRRQMAESTRLAEEAGRDIAQSLDINAPALNGVRRGESDVEPAEPSSTPRASGDRIPGPQWPLPFPSSGNWPGAGGADVGSEPSRERSESSILKQQLDLARKEVDLLQKQLEILKEIRQGVPAVLT